MRVPRSELHSRKPNLEIENGPFEDVFPTDHVDVFYSYVIVRSFARG